MLRINLLPPYIYEGAKRRNATILWVVLLLGLIGGFVYWKMQLDQEGDTIQKEVDRLTPIRNDATAEQNKTDEVIKASEVIRSKADFVTNANEYNRMTYPPLFQNIAEWTPEFVVYDSATPANDSVTVTGTVPSLADLGQYMLAMEQNDHLRSIGIAVDSVPGTAIVDGRLTYPDASGMPYNMKAHRQFVAKLDLVTPIKSAGEAGAIFGASAAPAQSGGGGMTAPGAAGGAAMPMSGAPGRTAPMGSPGPSGLTPMSGGAGRTAPMGSPGPSGLTPMSGGAMGGGGPASGPRGGGRNNDL